MCNNVEMNTSIHTLGVRQHSKNLTDFLKTGGVWFSVKGKKEAH